MTMGRTQDITPIRHAEEVRPAVEQQQLSQMNDKAADIKKDQVYQKKDSDMDSEYDAAEGRGNGAGYQGRRQNKRKKDDEEEGKVIVKGRTSFDVKI